AAAAIFVAAAVAFITSSREPAVTAVDDKKLTPPQTTLATAVKPPPPAATESKGPDGQPRLAAPTPATLGFAVLPWGEIFIDGKSQGASPPLREIRLSPGKHQIKIKNTDFPPYLQTVELEAGASQKIRHKFK
ncbi:MAG: PEGA domain-containing protein, partial [Sulfuricella sp.]|nr:PEGA domain-containing protein [Sulfuricella sp.]